MRFKLPTPFPNPPPEQRRPSEKEEVEATSEKGSAEKQIDDTTSSEIDSSEFQAGVQAAEASAQVWSKTQLYAVYLVLWLTAFVFSMCSGVHWAMLPFVTSAFQAHSLTATTQLVASLTGGLSVLPYGKLLNVWGRPQSFALMILFLTVGLVMMAACKNVGTYLLAQIFYQVGYNNAYFTLTIFISDTTSLRNRAMMIAFTSSPYLATVWSNGPLAQKILSTIGYKWGYGIFAIVIPIVASPLFFVFYSNIRKARKAGLINVTPHNRSFLENIKYYIIEFDVAGLFLIVAGLALFLLAFSLNSYQYSTWKSPLVISFIVIGFLLIVCFILYEKYVAPVVFVPWKLISNVTILTTYSMVASIYFAWYIWDNYFYSYLLVVYNLSVTHATYISNIYTIGSTFTAIVTGIIIRYNGKIKWLALYFGFPFTALGVGLMINFRQPNVEIGFIVMCQIFIAIGGGILVICEQITVMAVSSQQHVSTVLSLENSIANVFGAIGSAVASAMWTNIFPQQLRKNLPFEELGNVTTIVGDIAAQMSYPLGSVAREAIYTSYSQTQRYMLITATCTYIVTFISILCWNDMDVKHVKKIRGLVF